MNYEVRRTSGILGPTAIVTCESRRLAELVVHSYRGDGHTYEITELPDEDSGSDTAADSAKYESLGADVGKLVDEKQKAYGDSFHKCADYLKLLYPNGVPVEKYRDMLCIVRIFDKCMRLANQKEAFGESPYRDIVGYGLLGMASTDADEPRG